MRTRRLVLLLLPSLLLLLLLAPPASAEPAGSRFLTVRPGGASGPLALYDLETLRAGVRLPPGLRSADGRSFLAARVAGTRTALVRYALPSGAAAGRGSVPGRYTLAAVSSDGARVVLTSRAEPGRTTFAVVSTSGWRVQRRVTLAGAYGVEALSPDGSRLFLIRYDRGGYNLRLYDLRTGQLAFTPLAEGASAFGKMVGLGWTSVPTRDGRWLLTLYIKPGGGGFIHALDLRGAVGHCLDLPARFTDAATIRTASLALSPDEARLYVASPLAGRLLVLDLNGPRIAKEVRFAPSVGSTAPATRPVAATAAVSPGGETLAFTLETRIWSYRPGAGAVAAPIAVGDPVFGLGFTSDGRRLVVVRPDGRVTALDATTRRSTR